MAEAMAVGIIGGGWPGKAHARGYATTPGFKLAAIADLIPARRKAMMDEFTIPLQYADAMDLIADKSIGVVSICLPNHLHAAVAVAALKAGKHVVCEIPPAIQSKEARQIESAAAKSGKVVLYAAQRRFGANEQAAHQAIDKGYAGAVYHARASWTRTRGIPTGTGWYTDNAKAGGGALIDLGIHMLDLAWYLLGRPKPQTVMGITHRRLSAPTEGRVFDVEDAAFALVRFEGGQSLELSSSWALNQPPQQNGAVCRIYGQEGAVDVYTPAGAALHRSFNANGE